jgi:hypothetical protein
MSFNYTLFVQETPPAKKAPGTLWLKKSIGLVSIAMESDKYIHFAAGNGNLSITDGTYYLTISEGSNPPSSPAIGQIWLQDNRSYWMFLGKWNPFGGG